MSGIKVENGVATIELVTSAEFLGSTCPEGVFPPKGHVYQQFVFTPKKGTNGLVVFRSKVLGRHYDFWPYFWKDEKLFVENVRQYVPANPFTKGEGSTEDNFGIMVQYRPDRVFVTDLPARLAGGIEYVCADPMTIFRFIDGKINRRQFARACVLYGEVRKRAVEHAQTLAKVLGVANDREDAFHSQQVTISKLGEQLRKRRDAMAVLIQLIESSADTYSARLSLYQRIRRALIRRMIGERHWSEFKDAHCAATM